MDINESQELINYKLDSIAMFVNDANRPKSDALHISAKDALDYIAAELDWIRYIQKQTEKSKRDFDIK